MGAPNGGHGVGAALPSLLRMKAWHGKINKIWPWKGVLSKVKKASITVKGGWFMNRLDLNMKAR